MALFGDGPKRNWVIVYHTWFVTSCRWSDELVMDATKKEAQAAGALGADRLRSGSDHASYHLVPLPDHITVIHQKAAEKADV